MTNLLVSSWFELHYFLLQKNSWADCGGSRGLGSHAISQMEL